MRGTRLRVWGGFLCLALGLLSLWIREADAAPVPYARLLLPNNDGGVIFCRGHVTGPTKIITDFTDGGYTDPARKVVTVLMQLREGSTAAVRIGNSRVNGTTLRLNGTQLKAREHLTWDVGVGGMPYCIVENSDAGQILDPVYGLIP